MIEVSDRLLVEIAARAREDSPNEICGWLAGKGEKARKVYPVPNMAEDDRQTRFEMEPEAQLAAMREIRDLGLDLVGTYHSHPRSSAYPSEKDGELALYPDLAHLIVSLAGDEPEFRCWRITEKSVVELEVERSEGLV
ncbi:MAG: M67 family metallopeptidase [Rubrobacteraceae bacterium]